MTGSVTEGTTAYHTEIVQTADSYEMNLSVKSDKTTDITIALTLDTAAGGNEPAVRPDGEL